MSKEIISSYCQQEFSNLEVLKQVLINGKDQEIQSQFQSDSQLVNISEIKLRHNITKQDNIVDTLKKKIKLNHEQYQMKYIDQVDNISISSDLKYNPKYFKENSKFMNLCIGQIKERLIDQQQEKQENHQQTIKNMKQNLTIWFQQTQLQKNEEQLKNPSLQTKKLQGSYNQVNIKPNAIEGLTINGVITTKYGYKISYPQFCQMIKPSCIPDIDQENRLIRKIRPLNQYDLDRLDDLKHYVWKQKQYIQFFRVLLKVSQGNLEISQTLEQTHQLMKTSFYHVQTFYHISNRSWQISKLIRDLNKKNFYARERLNLYETMLSNIIDDLEEIFTPLLNNDDVVPKEEQFISFEQYKTRLQQVIFARETN